MVITSLQEKENRKIWVPIRGGNRGGWSLFDWEKVREMPYRDREMYLGNSAKIGVLDKGGKWRKKDWYLKREHLEGIELEALRSEAMRKDQERMNTALGYTDKDDDQALTPAEMQLLLKKIKGFKQELPMQANAIGLGFDKSRVQIRAKPTAKVENPHRLQGTFQQKEVEKNDDSKLEGVQRKRHKRRDHKHRERSSSRDPPQDSYQSLRKKKKRRHRSRSSSDEQHRHQRRHRSRSNSREKDNHKDYPKYRQQQNQKERRNRESTRKNGRKVRRQDSS